VFPVFSLLKSVSLGEGTLKEPPYLCWWCWRRRAGEGRASTTWSTSASLFVPALPHHLQVPIGLGVRSRALLM